METFSITTDYLKKRFDEFNNTYFYGKIKGITFQFSTRNRQLGCYSRMNKSITITKAYDGKIPALTYDSILIHEMVHAYLHAINDYDTGRNCHHGPNFYREAGRINNLTNNKYKISRTTNVGADISASKRVCTNFALIVANFEGREIIGKVAMSNIRFVFGFIKDRCTKIDIFLPKSGDNFADFTTSRRIFHYKNVNNDRYNSRLGECITSMVV